MSPAFFSRSRMRLSMSMMATSWRKPSSRIFGSPAAAPSDRIADRPTLMLNTFPPVGQKASMRITVGCPRGSPLSSWTATKKVTRFLRSSSRKGILCTCRTGNKTIGVYGCWCEICSSIKFWFGAVDDSLCCCCTKGYLY